MGDEDLGGCTDWGRFALAHLAGFLDEDLGPAWTHVRTWYDTADMAAAYRQAVQRIREDIARIWPPQQSPPAAAYLQRLDSMIASLGDVHEASTSNAEALGGVLTTLAGARKQVDGLHEQWQENETLYPPNSSTGDEPWRDQLNRQAQQVMVSTDSEVFAYLPRMTAPQAWDPGGPVVDPDVVPIDGSGGGSSSGGPGRGGASAPGSGVRPPAGPPARPPHRSRARAPLPDG